MHRLVIAEKNAAAAKIASILSRGKAKRGGGQKAPVYRFAASGDDWTVMGLRGHIVEWDYPKEFSSWEKIDPRDLVWAEPEKKNTQAAIVRVLKAEAKNADEVVVATDYDREGELIGLEALHIIQEVQPDIPVRRAHFSALTAPEVRNAFENTTDLDVPLARSAESRQLVDLAWGATLTRLVSRAARQTWQDYLSIGRVQSPTLALIVEREEEIDAFEPRSFWNLRATFEKGEPFVGEHAHGRWWNREEVENVLARLDGAEGATVASHRTSTRKDRPPAPFRTTSFLGQATRIGLSAYRAMRVAEDLYNAGYISYPRTDNTVYPKSLDLDGILKALEKSALGDDVRRLQGERRATPTRGKKQTTDHPPIHPVAAATKGQLKGDRWKVYELVVRRFLATLAPDARIESSKAELEVRGETFKASGQKLLKAGWRSYYPYASLKEERLPALEEGEEVAVLAVEMTEGETQPPSRFKQGTLIREMEKQGLGTKSTRHETIQKLYNRRYVQGDPLQPTPSGRSLIAALKSHVKEITESEMTALLETEMQAIAEGNKEFEEVVQESRELLEGSVVTLQEHQEEIGEQIREALLEQRVLGTCLECGNRLLIRRPRRGGRPFVGCEGYPDCEVTYNLPGRGTVEPAGEVCEACGVPLVRVTRGRNTETECINEKCEVFLEKHRLGACPSCGEDLLIRTSRRRKRFVGCSGYPDCDVTYPLPQRGRIVTLGEACEHCGAPRIKVLSGRRRPWVLCVNMECPSREEKQRAPASKGS